MYRIWRYRYLWILISLVGVCGCRVSPWSSDNIGTVAQTPAAGASMADVSGVSAFDPAEGDLRQVMAELRQLGAHDPTLQAQLLAELNGSDPSLWPLVVESFRSRVAYGQQLQQKETLVAATVEPYPALARDGSTLQESPVARVPETREPAATSPDQSCVSRLPATDQSLLPPSGWSGPSQVQNTLGLTPDGPVRLGPDITPISCDDEPSGDWQSLLAQAIGQLDARLKQNPNDARLGAQYAKLRLLQLAAGQKDVRAVPLPGMDPNLSRFWNSELSALEAMLRQDVDAANTEAWSEARQHLRNASAVLGEAVGLEVRNLTFCRAVQSFGSIKPFEKNEFTPGQRFLLYAEIENFRSEQTIRGFHTSLRSSYQIFNESGRQVASQESTTTEEYCRNPRRDYFIGCDSCLPESIRPGRYRLKLTVEDLKTGKVGDASIEFVVK